MSGYYRLVGKNVEPCTLEEWANHVGIEYRRVALDKLGEVTVSTVFLGLNYRVGDKGPALLFESMVFGGELDESQERYSTYDEALAGHAALLERVKQAEREGA